MWLFKTIKKIKKYIVIFVYHEVLILFTLPSFFPFNVTMILWKTISNANDRLSPSSSSSSTDLNSLWGQRWRHHIQISSVIQSCPTLWDPMNCSTPGLSVHHQLPEFTQTHVHWVSDAIQSSHPLSSPSPPAPNPPQHQSLFQWVNSSHEVARVLEFQL